MLYHYTYMKQKDTLTQFLRLCKAAQEEEKLKELSELFLTPEELEMLSARYAIIAALLKGEMTQREIAKRYHVSIAQITRGSNALKSVSPSLKKLLAPLGW